MFLSIRAVLACLGTFLFSAHAKIFEGVLETSESFALIGRFAFAGTVNNNLYHNISWIMDTPKGYNNLVVGTFYSDLETWKRVYKGPTTCVEKLELASALLCIDQTDCPDKPEDKVKKGKNNVGMETYHDGVTYVTSADSYKFGSLSGPKWFWITMLNCNVRACSGEDNGWRCDSPLMNITYKVSLMNLLPGQSDPLHPIWGHLSADETGLEIILSIAVGYSALMLVYSAWVVYMLHKDKKFHRTVQILVVSIVAMFLGSVFYLTHIVRLIFDGYGIPRMVYLAQVFYSISTTCQLLHLIFIAKGWTIVRRKISANGRVRIAVYITFYFALNISTVFWDGLGLTDGQVSYFYESSSGIFLLVLRALTVIWFGYSCYTTLRNFSLKKRFYTKLIILGSLWILSFPLTVLICLAVDEVLRFKITFAVYLGLEAFLQIVFMYMYNPKLPCNKGFPFHARTDNEQTKDKAEGEFLHDQLEDRSLSRFKDLTEKLMTNLLRVRRSVENVQIATDELQLLGDDDDDNFEDDDNGRSNADRSPERDGDNRGYSDRDEDSEDDRDRSRRSRGRDRDDDDRDRENDRDDDDSGDRRRRNRRRRRGGDEETADI